MDKYTFWAIERFVQRIIAYLIILPVITILLPVTALGNALGRLYYRWAR